MKKSVYTTLPPKQWWHPEGDGAAKTMQVIEDAAPGAVKTGLLDQYGTPLFRVPVPEPFGFRGRGSR